MTKKLKDKKAEPPPPERKESMDAAVKRSVLVVEAENEVRGAAGLPVVGGRKIRRAARFSLRRMQAPLNIMSLCLLHLV